MTSTIELETKNVLIYIRSIKKSPTHDPASHRKIQMNDLRNGVFCNYKSIGERDTGYFIMFIVCGLAYLLVWGIMQLLVPKMKKIVY